MEQTGSVDAADRSDEVSEVSGLSGDHEESVARARAVALRYLAHRHRTEVEMRRRLRREFDAKVVDSIVDELRASGYIDDDAFASAWAQARNSRKPRSANAVRRELLSKGVGRAAADEAVSGLDDEESAFRAGLHAAQRNADLPVEAFKRRMWGFLQRRGYGTSVTRLVIERLGQEVRGDEALS